MRQWIQDEVRFRDHNLDQPILFVHEVHAFVDAIEHVSALRRELVLPQRGVLFFFRIGATAPPSGPSGGGGVPGGSPGKGCRARPQDEVVFLEGRQRAPGSIEVRNAVETSVGESSPVGRFVHGVVVGDQQVLQGLLLLHVGLQVLHFVLRRGVGDLLSQFRRESCASRDVRLLVFPPLRDVLPASVSVQNGLAQQCRGLGRHSERLFLIFRVVGARRIQHDAKCHNRWSIRRFPSQFFFVVGPKEEIPERGTLGDIVGQIEEVLLQVYLVEVQNVVVFGGVPVVLFDGRVDGGRFLPELRLVRGRLRFGRVAQGGVDAADFPLPEVVPLRRGPAIRHVGLEQRGVQRNQRAAVLEHVPPFLEALEVRAVDVHDRQRLGLHQLGAKHDDERRVVPRVLLRCFDADFQPDGLVPADGPTRVGVEQVHDAKHPLVVLRPAAAVLGDEATVLPGHPRALHGDEDVGADLERHEAPVVQPRLREVVEVEVVRGGVGGVTVLLHRDVRPEESGHFRRQRGVRWRPGGARRRLRGSWPAANFVGGGVAE